MRPTFLLLLAPLVPASACRSTSAALEPRAELVSSSLRSDPAQEEARAAPWSAARAAAHAALYNDPEAWDLERLERDAELLLPLPDDLAPVPFPHVAFPAPDYARTAPEFPGLTVGPIPLAGGQVGSLAAVNLPLPEEHAGAEDWFERMEAEPVLALVAMGDGDLENVNQWAISRSHPHYLFQGTFSGAPAEIDWMALRLADGAEIAVVNGRVLDLAQGNLVFARQQEDGSILLYQDPERLGPGRPAEIQSRVAQRVAANRANPAWSGGRSGR